MHMMVKQIDNKGFTLIEIAIVMVIIGLLAGGAVPLMSVLSERKTRTETLDYLIEARAALVNFAKINGRLPWADTTGDGVADANQNTGTLPFQTLGIRPADPQRRPLGYALNNSLGTDLSTSCFALRAGLGGAPRVVDFDGTPASFSVAAVLISAGSKDADRNGNVFDAVNAGGYIGNNANGNPNYIRYPSVTNFDDMVVYLDGVTLFGETCGSPEVAVSNGTSIGANIFVYNRTTSSDIGIVPPSTTITYGGVTSGSRIELRTAASGGGVIIATSTPVTPVTVAGSGVALIVP
jgi:prepilin-type N-terminal cleavage/methylation domain-containing protein